MLKFEWDERKNQSNRKKHGIWFEEAQQAFGDSRGIVFFDENSFGLEERYVLLGFGSSIRILVVIYCERNKGQSIRIISARKATKKEVKRYEKGI